MEYVGVGNRNGTKSGRQEQGRTWKGVEEDDEEVESETVNQVRRKWKRGEKGVIRLR